MELAELLFRYPPSDSNSDGQDAIGRVKMAWKRNVSKWTKEQEGNQKVFRTNAQNFRFDHMSTNLTTSSLISRVTDKHNTPTWEGLWLLCCCIFLKEQLKDTTAWRLYGFYIDNIYDWYPGGKVGSQDQGDSIGEYRN